MNFTRMQGILPSESLYGLLIIGVCCLLTGCTSPRDHSLRHKANKPYDPTITESPPECIGVIFSFAGSDWMDGDELKHKARQKLREEGNQVDDSYECCINVEQIGKHAGCTVEFYKGFGDRIFLWTLIERGRFRR